MVKQETDFIQRTKKTVLGWSSLIFLLLGAWLATALFLLEEEESLVLLNDRVAQIIGTEALQSGICAALELDGKGQLIGLADSGLDQGNLEQLPLDLKSDPGSKPRIAYLQSMTEHVVPRDVSGHGTHMAGTIVGSGAASDGRYCGIAPGASLYFQALTNEYGKISVPGDVANLFQAAYTAGVRIHVDGWGELKNQYNGRTASIDQFIQEHPDFLAVFSAGNAGAQTDSLTAEANSKNALVVGASQSPRPTVSADAADADLVSKTSSAGPTADGRIKPDLLAPASAVVSTASSLVKSNFSANPQYTILGGSSMAAAVTGGSAALLTQYLQQNEPNTQPSAALLKTLLIQGARKTQTDINRYGFGILDMTTTVLSMQHQLIQWEDQAIALQQSEARDYYYNVEDSSQPLTATLVWTDPVLSRSNAGNQLVNNLNLQIIAPDGTIYYGNDFLGQGTVDVINNVEQIVIENPSIGTYTLRVEAANIQTEAGQMYAIAYGQNIASATIQEVEKQQATLSNGQILPFQNKAIVCCYQGEISNIMNRSMVGSQAYWTKDVLYVVGNEWEEEGVQLLTDTHGTLMTSINSLARSGGYYIAQEWLTSQQDTLLYNEEARPIQEIPDGVGVQAVINPVSQTLYQVRIQGTEANGKIARIDSEKGQLFLQGEELPYKIATTTAVSYTNTQVEGGPQARPFGYMDRPNVEQLVPGMQVHLLIEEKTRQVYVIEAERPTVFAQIKEIDLSKRTITLAGDQIYSYTNQTRMEHNSETIPPNTLEIGQWVGGIVRETKNGNRELVSLQVMDQIIWGQILYFGESSQTIYILDQRNQFRDLKLADDVLMMRGRAVIGSNAITEGAWVRVALNETTNCIERIDIATGVREEDTTLVEYNLEQGSMKFANDAQYEVHDTTLFVREGKVVSAENLLVGEAVKLSILPGSSRSDMYLARVEVQTNSGQEQLFSKLEAHYLDDQIVLVGVSQGKTVQIYRADGSMQQLQVGDSGAFATLLPQQEGETSLTVSTQNTTTGEVDIQRIEISLEVEMVDLGFCDIVGSLYQEEILALKDQGILTGYSDGTFRPNEPITRMGFLSLLVQATGEIQVSLEGINYFKDIQDVPWWGLSTVHTILQRGWSRGFEDACIHPQSYLKVKDVQTLLLNCEKGKEVNIPLLQGAYLTREEAASIIYQLLY